MITGLRGKRDEHAVRFKDIADILAGQNNTAGTIDTVARSAATAAAAIAGTAIATANAAGTTAATANANANEALQNQADTLAFRVKDGSSGALLELIAANDPSGAVSVARIEAQNILLVGSVGVEMLTVGLGRNLLANTRFRRGLSGWAYTETGLIADESGMSIRAPGETWSGAFFPTLMIEQNGNETSGSTYVQWFDTVTQAGDTAPGVPVKPNDWIEVSANISAHRCDVTLHIVWFNAAGAELSVTVADANATVQNDLGPSDQPDLWERPFFIAQAPANAAFASLRIVKGATGYSGANSFLFVHKPQMAISHENATIASAYSEDGSTLIDGTGVITASLSAQYISLDGPLEVQDYGTIRVNKSSPYDTRTAGFYMGKEVLGDGGGTEFAVAISIARGDNSFQEFRAFENNFLSIINADFYRNPGPVGFDPNDYTDVTSTGWVILDRTLGTVKLDILGAGGGGMGENSGAAGGDTIVELFDGLTPTGIFWIATGGAPGTVAPTVNGEDSDFGVGGLGDPSTPADATGYGAGGGGGGAAGQLLEGVTQLVSNLADPRLFITIGAAGVGGTGTPEGGDGSPGYVRYVQGADNLQRADVLPLAPTFSGFFVQPFNLAFEFPDFGAGMWVIWHDSGSSNPVTLGDVEIDELGTVINIDGEGCVTFIAEKTPFCLTPSTSNIIVQYLFYKMGPNA